MNTMTTSLPHLIGVIQLPSLAGAPSGSDRHPADLLQTAGLLAVREAQIFAQAGFDGVLLENTGDAPYYRTATPPETVASMAIIAAAVREAVKIQLGIQVLKNDAQASLAIAAVTGCDFVRMAFSIENDPAFLLRERERLCGPLTILADLASEEIEALALNGVEGRVISGRTPPLATLQLMSQVARENNIPLYLSEGVSLDKLSELRPWIDGVLIGSAFRKGKGSGSTLDSKKVREFARTYNRSDHRSGRGKRRMDGKAKKGLRKISS